LDDDIFVYSDNQYYIIIFWIGVWQKIAIIRGIKPGTVLWIGIGTLLPFIQLGHFIALAVKLEFYKKIEGDGKEYWWRSLTFLKRIIK